MCRETATAILCHLPCAFISLLCRPLCRSINEDMLRADTVKVEVLSVCILYTLAKGILILSQNVWRIKGHIENPINIFFIYFLFKHLVLMFVYFKSLSFEA